MCPHGVMFHHFHGDFPPYGQGSITAAQLGELLEFVGRERILSAEEWLWRVARDALRAGDHCLTFDDNLRCQFDVAAPVLRHLGLTAFWFVPTAVMQGRLERLEIYRAFRLRSFPNVAAFYAAFEARLGDSTDATRVAAALARFEPGNYLAEYPFYSDADRRFRFIRDHVLGPRRYQDVMDAMIVDQGVDLGSLARDLWMTPAHVRALHGEGHIIGLHSHTHPTRLADLPPLDQIREYHENHAQLTDLLGAAPLAMSHPCNSYTADTLIILRQLGVQVGFRANMAPGYSSELEIPREDHANIMRELHPCASLSSPATSPATPR